MKQKMEACVHDVWYCIKISIIVALIPITLGLIGSIVYLLIKGQTIGFIDILMGVRNFGLIFSCGGLFICALGFLQPMKLLRPLSYHNTWQQYFKQFGFVGAMFCISILVTTYFLVFDVVLYYLVV